MAVKKFNPITPGSRYHVAVSKAELTKGVAPEKALLVTIGSTGGRNKEGHRTMRYRGGGHKRRYRIIDFKRDKDGVSATVQSIQYDPYRSAYIALVEYTDGERRYILAPKGLEVGHTIVSGRGAAPENGNCLYLAEVPLGAFIHNVELHPGAGGILVRSAGNSDHNLEVMGKAGRNRWKGRRPRNRPVAMNPVDHPMGGGEGRASGGHPRSRKGLKAKGMKTRSRTKRSNALILTRRKGGSK